MFRLAVAVLLVGTLGFWLGLEVLRALKTGVANAGGTRITRRGLPAVFWLAIAIQTAFAAAAVTLLLRLLREALARAA